MKKTFKTKSCCPACGSKKIITLGLDQLCCSCDWDNSFALVKWGFMDSPTLAASHHAIDSTKTQLDQTEKTISKILNK